MRMIEKRMVNAIKERESWASANTSVMIQPNCDAEVFLFGNHIGTWSYTTDKFDVNQDTLKTWSTATTISRLRALGVNVCQRNHIVYLDGEAI